MKCLNKTIEYGLYLLALLLPLGTRWIIKPGELNGGPWEYGTYSLYATDILLIIVLLLFIVREIASPGLSAGVAMTEKTVVRDNRIIWWLIGGLLLISMVSVFGASDKPLALYKFGWLVLGLGLFWLLSRAGYKKIKLIYALLAGVFLQACLGIWQFLSQATFANKWLGLAAHRGVDLGASVIETVGQDGVGERWLRAYGGLDHPNILGGMLTISIILVINQIIINEKSFRITNYELRITNKMQNAKSNSLKFIVFYFLLIMFTAGLFFSFSRSAWLALAAGLAARAVLAAVRGNLKTQKVLAETILAMGALLLVLFSQYPNLVETRLGGLGRLENKSNIERLTTYQEARRLIKTNWLGGVGLGNYTSALNRERPGQASYFYQPAHNAFLLVWAETGIAGLLFFLGLLVYMFVRFLGSHAYLAYRQIGRLAGSPGLKAGYDIRMAILTALIVLMTLDHWLFSLHFGVLFFWLVLGLIARPPAFTKNL